MYNSVFNEQTNYNKDKSGFGIEYPDTFSDEHIKRIESIEELIENADNFPYTLTNQINGFLYYEYTGSLENEELYDCQFQGCMNIDPNESSLVFGLGGEMSSDYNNVYVYDLYSDDALDRVKKALDKISEMENTSELFIGEYYSDAKSIVDSLTMIKNSIDKLGIEPISDIQYRLTGYTDDYKDVILDIDLFKNKLDSGSKITYSEAFRYIKVLEFVKSIALKRALKNSEQEFYGLDLKDLSNISSSFAVDNNEVIQYIVITYNGNKKAKIVKETCRFDIDDEDAYYELCNKISKEIYDRKQKESNNMSLSEIFESHNNEPKQLTTTELFEDMKKHVELRFNLIEN